MKKLLFIFALFIFIISCGTTPEMAPVENAEPVALAVEEEPQPVANTNELYLPQGTSIRETQRGRVLETNPKIIFGFAKTAMPANANAVFAKIIEFLDKNPNVRLVIEGHTSNKGIAYPYNYNLSVNRVRIARNYLVNNGVNADRLIEKPLGEALPESNIQANLRRYEFVIIENQADLDKYNSFVSTLNVRKETVYTGN
ncbi:OmpA family protein [Brachyspira pilosicoli]|uniref:OmpA family protein n=1 Tax=Brachyspira pilosicoli TaxID=52584 RepID=A0A5C8EVZ5_BRAPL|nr:OmpA family protein [Brachyspira pilosicoli]TXJ42177.1 OmpA family protein [Brachyspira pilosicoli]